MKSIHNEQFPDVTNSPFEEPVTLLWECHWDIKNSGLKGAMGYKNY